MQVRMQNAEPLTEQQIGEFLRGTEVIELGARHESGSQAALRLAR
jgi:hypothetical protein